MTNLNNFLLIKEKDKYEFKEINQSNFNFDVNDKSILECVFVIFNGNISINIELNKNNDDANIKVLYLVANKDCVDIQVKVKHLAPETKSSQIIKGIAKDNATVSFNGNIHISQNSQRVDGYQNHRGLLLSDNAIIRAIPELEIYADDVKCSHGSAVGPIDKDALFYLMSRGIDQTIAQKILIKSFISDIVPEQYQHITDEWISQHV